jgi:hypothetical protein
MAGSPGTPVTAAATKLTTSAAGTAWPVSLPTSPPSGKPSTPSGASSVACPPDNWPTSALTCVSLPKSVRCPQFRAAGTSPRSTCCAIRAPFRPACPRRGGQVSVMSRYSGT